MNYLANASSYLVEALVGLALYAVLLRFWLQWVRGDFRNQVGQFLIATTNPVVIPLRKILPSVGSIDTATIVLALLVAIFKTVLLSLIQGFMPPVLNIIIYALAELLRCTIYLFMAGLIVSILASWINPHSYHPLVATAQSIANPILAPFRRLIPPLGGLDISPIFVFLILNLGLQFLQFNCPHIYACFI
jgi:YggT family protein